MPKLGTDRDLELLRVIDEGVSGEIGEGFFRCLVVALAKALGVANAFASEFNADRSMGLLFAEWKLGGLVDNPPPFLIAGTPCQLTLAGEIVAFEARVAQTYPCLQDIQAESYLAIPLKTNGGDVVGHLAVIDTRARRWHETDFGILRIFAARAAAEIERRRFERDLEQARQAAEQANLAKTQFLAHMSHEIRTPLNAIFGYAQLLGRDAHLSAAQRDAIAQIGHAGEHLLGLVNEALDIAKIEAGRVELNLAATDLEHAIAHVVAVARLRMEQSGLDFHFQPPPAWPPRLIVDERKLRQILLNLLNNAAQYTAKGLVSLTLQVESAGAAAYRLAFRVRDTGIGLEREAHEKIFEPFYRTEAGWRLTEGSGLGLAIARRLVMLMGGSITVDSTPGLGSEFTVSITVAAAGQQAIEPAANPALGVSAAELAQLRDRARRGDVTGIVRMLDGFAGRPQLADGFILTLRDLVRRYDMKGLRGYLAPLVP